MATERTVLIRNSTHLDRLTPKDDFRKESRIALAELFSEFAYALRVDEEIDLTKSHVLELYTERDNLNSRLVLKLIEVGDVSDKEAVD